MKRSRASISWAPATGATPSSSKRTKGGGGGFTTTLQSRVDEALSSSASVGSSDLLNKLVADLAGARETPALVRVWDAMGGSKEAKPETWKAVERLHSLGKGRIPSTGTLALPPLGRKTLEPARRLHKICKGRRV